MRKTFLSVLIALLLLAALLCACEKNGNAELSPASAAGDLEAAADSDMTLPDQQYFAWVVYWDLKNTLSEIEWMQKNLQGLSWFAANFDSNEKLMIPPALLEFIDKADAEFSDWAREDYLTIVNDKLLADGTYSLKDTEMLRRKFSDTALMEAHAAEVVALARDNGFDGLELDYEAIRSDMELWQLYLQFCEKVYDNARAQGLKLRILLEPSAPTESLSFPEGPEYVMMCYNLYGSGTEKGPKADREFLEKMVAKMSALPGRKTFALATGGYDWKRGEAGQQITEQNAFFIRADNNLYVRRSESSYALRYEYYDEDNALHTVWYADSHTIAHWMEIIANAGLQAGEEYGVMLWRLGGNLTP